MPAVEVPFDRRYPSRPIVGVGAVILVQPSKSADLGWDGEVSEPHGVVLIKRRFEPLAGRWSLPGGTLDVGETLAAGVAREVREETGLVVEVQGLVEVLDRVIQDDAGRVLYHYVIIDYLCRPVGGALEAGSDVSEVVIADPQALNAFAVTPQVEAVVRHALQQSSRE